MRNIFNIYYLSATATYMCMICYKLPVWDQYVLIQADWMFSYLPFWQFSTLMETTLSCKFRPCPMCLLSGSSDGF